MHAQRLTFPIDFVLTKLITDYPRVGHNRNVWGMKLLKLDFCQQKIRYGLQNLTQHY